MFAIVTIAYSLLSLASYDVFGALTIGVTFFPPAGLTFAAFLLLPRRRWAAVAVAIVVAEVGVDMGKGNGFWWSLAWAAANLVEPLVGAVITRRIAPVLELPSRRAAVAIVVGGIAVGPAFGATIGATTLAVVNDLEWFSSWGHIWVGDALGVLAVAPAILVFARPPAVARARRSRAETYALVALFAVVAVAFFVTERQPIGYPAMALLGWPALRYGPRGVALMSVAMASLATAATARGHGPWAETADISAHSQLGHQQSFLLAAIGAAWLLALEANERQQAVRSRQFATQLWQSEHEVALTLQRSLMPPTVARTETTTAAGTYLPAPGILQVGGDWYDVVDTGDGRIVLLVGDVVGHGLGAATTMGKLSSAARALAFARPDPAEIVRGIEAVAQNVEDARMATMACAILDPESRTLRYSIAGHPPPMLRTPDGVVHTLDGAGSLPLATGFSATRVTASVEIPPGSLVVLYTDGLVERRESSIDIGLDALARAVAGVDPSDPAAACDAIVHTMLSGREQQDDVALLCVVLEPVRRFRYALAPDPALVAPLRHEFATWLALHELDTSDGVDVVIALGEAVNNSVEHAYRGTARGTITVEASVRADGALLVTVADDGTWKEPAPDTTRGRGLHIMRATCDVRHSRTDRGTTVTLTRRRGRVAPAGSRRRPPAFVLTGRERIIRPEGQLALDALAALDDLIAADAAGGCDGIVLDLSGVTALDSHGLRLIEGAAAKCSARATPFAIVASPGTLPARLLAIASFETVVPVFESMSAIPLIRN